MIARLFKRAEPAKVADAVPVPAAEVDLLNLLRCPDAWTIVLTFFKCEKLEDLDDLAKICILSPEIGKRFLGDDRLVDLIRGLQPNLTEQRSLETAIDSILRARDAKVSCSRGKDILARIGGFLPGVGSFAYSVYEFTIAGIIKKATDSYVNSQVAASCSNLDTYLIDGGWFSFCNVINFKDAAADYAPLRNLYHCSADKLSYACDEYYKESFHNAIGGGVFVASFLMLCAGGIYAAMKERAITAENVGAMPIAKICDDKLLDLIAPVVGVEKSELQSLTVDNVISRLDSKLEEILTWQVQNARTGLILLQRAQRMQEQHMAVAPKIRAVAAPALVEESKAVRDVVLDVRQPTIVVDMPRCGESKAVRDVVHDIRQPTIVMDMPRCGGGESGVRSHGLFHGTVAVADDRDELSSIFVAKVDSP